MARGDSGASAVEAAFIFPVLFFLVFGMIEYALVLRDKIAITSAVRTAGRLASSEPRAAGYADVVTNTPASITGLVPDAVKAVAAGATGVPWASIKEVWVYQASASGLPLSGSLGNGGCGTNCVRYTYDPARVWIDPSSGLSITGGFNLVSGSWAASSINACAGDPLAQSVGVYLKVQHNFILGGLIGKATLDVSDNTAFKFEPIPTAQGTPCK